MIDRVWQGAARMTFSSAVPQYNSQAAMGVKPRASTRITECLQTTVYCTLEKPICAFRLKASSSIAADVPG